MRILCTYAGGLGHVEPLIPVARAAQATGHAVTFTGGYRAAAALDALGFDVFPLGKPPTARPSRMPLQEVDPARDESDVRERFIRGAARDRVPLVTALCGDWQPDLLLCDEMDFGSMVAAERLGVPSATMLVLAAGTLARPDVVAGPLDELRTEHGLPPDPELAMLTRRLVLAPFPPAFRDPAFPLPATAHSFRPHDVAPARHGDGTPMVYFTLGTVFNLESGDLFARVLAGLRELPIEAVVTVGEGIDPEELGPLPGNIEMQRFIPQALVLPRCSAVVSHGGSGTVVAALAHGLPQVLIPMGADQPLNAARCKELGVALVLDAVRVRPEEVREAVSTVLSDPGYRIAAEAMAKEIATLPGPEQAVRLLEQL